MKVSEIKQSVIAFILADINLSLSRLGVSENLEVQQVTDDYIILGSNPIRQMPMMFKKVTIDGTLCLTKDDSIKMREGDSLINVSLDFKTLTFDDGHNGTRIGSALYRVNSIPENLEEDDIRYYIRKIRGIQI